ncbi:Spindle pole protein, putative [Giardia lamblia P15]|uniref:Spindle pole protein, putative n=1 Tax=Giardia intestinalis (strain P15) TaxID=658858 RepID=E1F9I4_GIAIA|nr:Spindle pole protein, putative [Giardia lamblia P15]
MEARLKLLEDSLEKANINSERIAEEKTTLLSTLTAEMQSVREESKAAVQAAEADTELIQTRLAETIREKDRQIKECKNNIIDLQNELMELRKNQEFLIADGNSTQSRLNAQLKGLCSRYAVLQAQSEADAASQKEKLAQLNSDLSLAKKVHEQYVMDTEERIGILTEQLERSKKDYMTSIDEKDAQVRELYTVLEQQKIQFNELLAEKEHELTRLTNANENMKQKREEELAQMSQLQSQLEQSHAKCNVTKTTGELEQLKLQSELEMVRAKSEIIQKTNTTEVERLQAELLSSKGMLAEVKTDLETQLRVKDDMIKKLQENISALKTELSETTMDATIKIQELNGRLEILQEVQVSADNTRISDVDQLRRQLEEQQEYSKKEIAHYRQQISKLMEDLADVNTRYANSVEKREREIIRLKQESKDEALANATKITNLTAELLGAKRRVEKEQATVAEISSRQLEKISDLQEQHEKELAEKDGQIQKLQATLKKLKTKYTENITELKATVSALVTQTGYSENTVDSDGSLSAANLTSSITVSSLNPGTVAYAYPPSTFSEPSMTPSAQQGCEKMILQLPQTGSLQGLMLTPRMNSVGNASECVAKPSISMTPGSMGAM